MRPTLEDFTRLGHDLFVVGDDEGRFVWVSEGWAGATGWSAEDLLGRPRADFLHPGDRQAAEREHGGSFVGPQPRRFRCRFRCSSGD